MSGAECSRTMLVLLLVLVLAGAAAALLYLPTQHSHAARLPACLPCQRPGLHYTQSLSLSVSRSLSLSVSDENSFFPNVFLLQQEKATLFPIVETKKRLLSGLVRGPIVVTNCQNGPKSCPLSRDAPLPWLARPDKLLQMGGNSVSIELCDCFEKCPHQGRLMTRYISS